VLDSSRVPRLLHTGLPGVTLLFALIFAPWFWGCTWPLGVALLGIFLLAATFSWSLGMLLRRRPARLPTWLLLSVLGLLFQGWCLALNGQSNCDPGTGLYLPVAGHVAWLPGSVDQERSRGEMIRLSGLLGAGVIAAWLGRDPAWRRRLLWAMAAVGASIVLLGCAQRWTQATDIFWNPGRRLDFFFATYRNVTNAGEFLNLVLPLGAALVAVAAIKQRSPVRLAAATAALAILATGSFVCGSKLAPGASLLGGAAFVFFAWRDLRRQAQQLHGRVLLFTAAVVLLALVALVESAGLGVTWDRWDRVFRDQEGTATFSHRLMVDQVCLLAAPDAGVTGFGPGAFRAVFPYYSVGFGDELRGVWSFAHDDYAQTVVEWGAVGSASWSLYFFGGMLTLLRVRRLDHWGTEDRLTAAGLLATQLALAVTALVDFPLQIASIQLGAAVVTGLAWSSEGWTSRQNPSVEKTRYERRAGP
jgi:hypothetical protein